MIGPWLLGALLAAAPLTVATRIECGGAAERCKAVEATLGAALQAEGLKPAADCGGAAWNPGCFELLAKVYGVPVFFELRDGKGIQLIAHTDFADYRAPYATQDMLVAMGYVTVLLAPLAQLAHTETTVADEARAWKAAARRVLHQGVTAHRTYLGVREVRGPRWTVSLGSVDVRRVRTVEELTPIIESSYEPVAPESDEAKEGAYSAGVLLSEIATHLDPLHQLDGLGDGHLKMIVIGDQFGRFGARVMLRENSSLTANRELVSTLRRAAFMTSAVPLAGYTRIEFPLTIRRAAKK